MVEMIIKSKLIVSGLLFAVMSVATAQAQEVTARIPELEANENYMSLVRNDSRLRVKSDSLMSVVRQLRGELNRTAESRDSLAQQRIDSISVLLTDVEGAIYALRSQKMKLIDQMNTIEQEHVLSSLGNIGEAQAASSSCSPTIPRPAMSAFASSLPIISAICLTAALFPAMSIR